MIFYWWAMVQIIAENLPISSSGHVQLLHQMFPSAIQEFGQVDLQAFDYFVQGANALIFLIYFFSTWWQLVVGQPIAVRYLFSLQVWKESIWPVIVFGFVADGLTVVMWWTRIADKIAIPLYVGFFITFCALMSLLYSKERASVKIWSCKHAVVVGFVQGCSLLPGVSRFATTLAALQWLGYEKSIAFAVSFLLQWPLLMAGSLKGMLTLYDHQILQSLLTAPFLGVMVSATFVAYAVLVAVGHMVEKNSLWKFAGYMVFPIILAWYGAGMLS